MQITKKHWVAVGVGFLVAVLAGWWLYEARTSVSPVPTTTNTFVATSTSSITPVTQASVGSTTQPFPINASDTIASWSFKGVYAGNDTLVAQANADISHLKSLIGKGQYDDYDLYIGIGNDDDLMGDGRSAYQNYNRAIPIHPKKGLVYVNLAHLMDQLGAYHTAADAYTKAVTVEPGMLEYHIERLTYLTRQFGSNNALIVAAFADASKQFGDTAQTRSIEAEWLTGLKRYADAIKAWETVKMLSPGNTSAIDAAIARLKAKL
jgi:tetratricopeptide (TPR) repeat protein